jgi:hypothetical protein
MEGTGDVDYKLMQHKVKKYNRLLKNADSGDMAQIYQQRLNYYQGQSGGDCGASIEGVSKSLTEAINVLNSLKKECASCQQADEKDLATKVANVVQTVTGKVADAAKKITPVRLTSGATQVTGRSTSPMQPQIMRTNQPYKSSSGGGGCGSQDTNDFYTAWVNNLN